MKVRLMGGACVSALALTLLIASPTSATVNTSSSLSPAATVSVAEASTSEPEAVENTTEPGPIVELPDRGAVIEEWTGSTADLSEEQAAELEEAGVDLSAEPSSRAMGEIPEDLLKSAGSDCVIPLGENVIDGLEACAAAPETAPSGGITAPDSSSRSAEASQLAASGPQASPCFAQQWEPKYIDRTHACFGTSFTVTVVDVRTGQAAGNYLMEMIVETSTSRSGGMVITDSTSLRSSFHTGVAAGRAVNISGTLTCVSQQCTTINGTYTGSTNGTWATAKGASKVSFPETRDHAREIVEIWDFMLGVTDVPTKIAGFSLKPRCDNASVGGMGSGCVYPQFTPKVIIPTNGVTAQAGNHVLKAIGTGLPNLLTRASLAVKTANNKAVCPKSLPRDSGYQCDEYPFASTTQGGKTPRVPADCRWAPIPGDGPNGTSRCMILEGHNTKAGSIVGSFYVQNRILVGDNFYVGAQYVAAAG